MRLFLELRNKNKPYTSQKHQQLPHFNKRQLEIHPFHCPSHYIPSYTLPTLSLQQRITRYHAKAQYQQDVEGQQAPIP